MRRLLLSALLGAAASTSSRADDAAFDSEVLSPVYRQYEDALLAQLQASDVALADVLAAQLLRLREGRPTPSGVPYESLQQRNALVQRARASDTDDQLVWWSLAFDCPASPSACDSPSALVRLRELAPDNLAVRLAQLPDPSSASFDAALADAADGAFFDKYAVERAAAYDRLMSQTEPPSRLTAALDDGGETDIDGPSLTMMFAKSLALMSRPPPMPFQQPCRDSAHTPGSQRHATCLKIAASLAERSDSVVGAKGGTSLWQQIAVSDAERARARARTRTLAWQIETALDLIRAQRQREGSVAMDARVRAAGATELSVWQGLLRDEGIALEPPADWDPPAGWVRESGAEDEG